MKTKELSIEKLRSYGVKVTPQRLAIVDFLEKDYNHPAAEEIYKKIKKQYPSVSFATVYNTLDKLEELKEVIKLKIADDRVHYEYHTEPHHHFYCRKCHSIIDIPVACKQYQALEKEGYAVEEVHGYFKGVCKNCKK